MRSAPAAVDLRPQERTPALRPVHVFLRDGRPEAGPARARIELLVRSEQIGAAGDAPIDALVLGVPVGTREGPLRALLARHAVLLRGELPAPLFVRLDDLVLHHVTPSLCRVDLDRRWCCA